MPIEWTPELPEDADIAEGKRGHVSHTKALRGGIVNLRAHADGQDERIGELETLTTDGRLSESALSATLDALVVLGLVAGVGSAAANTSLIQGALDSGAKRVYVPAGEWYVTSLSVPESTELSGAYARTYTGYPTVGTRLRNADAAQTDAIISCKLRAKLSRIAIIGAGKATANASGIEITQDGAVIRDVAVGHCLNGIDGNYNVCIVDNAHLYDNREMGIRDCVDSMVQFCTINANGAHGIYYGTGSNSGHIIGNRIEWNSGHGISIYQATSSVISGNFIDRNGRVGIRLVEASFSSVTGNTVKRNGRLSQGTNADDCNILLTSNSRMSVTGNTTITGENDGGGGYLSPRAAVRSSGNDSCAIVGNDFTGGTAVHFEQPGTADTNMRRFGNVCNTVETVTNGRVRYAQDGVITVAASGSGALTLAAPPTSGTYTEGVSATLIVNARSSAGSRNVASIPIVIFRNSGDALLSSGALSAKIGTRIAATGGSYLNVSATINAGGTEITVAVTNANASETFYVSAYLTLD